METETPLQNEPDEDVHEDIDKSSGETKWEDDSKKDDLLLPTALNDPEDQSYLKISFLDYLCCRKRPTQLNF